ELDRRRLATWICVGLGACALLGGVVSVLGWLLAEPGLADWSGDGITIKANSALGAVLTGVAILLCAAGWRGAAACLGALVAARGASPLLEQLTSVGLGIDTLLFDEPAGAVATDAPGRMGLPACSAFLLLGVGLLLAAAPGRRSRS